MSRTEREIIKSLRQLGKSIKQDPIKEKESYDMLLNSFREMFPHKTKLTYNFYLSLKPVAVSLLAFVFIFIAGFGTIAVAKNAVPGDMLYPVKRVVEKSRMVLVFDQSKKAVLRAEILTNRLSEVSVLTEKANKGDKKYELELNVLAQNFTNDLKVLTKQIGDQVESLDGEPAEPPFPDEDLLYIDERMLDNGSLPIEDNRQVYTVMPSKELEKLLAETKELLAEENLALAFVKLQQAEKLVEEKEPVSEPDVEPVEFLDSEPAELLPLDEEPIEDNNQSSIINHQSSIINQTGSVGQILLKQEDKEVDVRTGIERVKDPRTGMTREK
ncbi:hypothetical protein KKG58_00310 [Patescibacteria group bacterium]|nr:hypothetical protein [Patescibacteria group bacterium]